MTDKLAIIVPFRDRQEHLDIFVPHMHSFLEDKGIDYDIFIAEQTDDRPFNYGKLCNIVVKELPQEYTYFAFHDIDMLPINDDCDYGYPEAPIHLATQVQVHDYKLPYVQYFGGVVLISREDFEKANGYSNEYWGYGFEDLDLLYRLQRSGAYLEKFYDLNKTYSTYNELDILPYRIEDVNVTLNEKSQKITFVDFDKNSHLYGTMNSLTSNLTKKDFCISFWFNDDSDKSQIKNLFAFEGSNTGVFLSNGNQIISQIWDIDNNHYEVVTNYSRNRWNHCVVSYNSKSNKLDLYFNNIKISKELPENFEIYDYKNHCIKISDEQSSVKISNILIFNKSASYEFANEIYYNGEGILDLIETKYGYFPQIYYQLDKLYKNNLLLDSGILHNHIKILGKLNTNTTEVKLTDEIYLPIRLEGRYNSLNHDNDTDIIKNYYTYNPDVMENADIFFEDILTEQIDYKDIGLNSLEYKIVKEEKEPNYKQFRIIT
jgi:hypothetical protein